MQNFSNGIIPVVDNKVSTLYNYAVGSIAEIYDRDEAEEIASWLVDHVTNKPYRGNQNELVNQSELIHFCNAVDRLKNHEPIQYIIGIVDFLGLKIHVSKDVLIPRSETEELIFLIKKYNPNFSGKVIDIGTGSGCIALSLAKDNPNSRVFGIDVSEGALAIATKNAITNTISNVSFFKHHILEKELEDEYDMIVSNPPYVSYAEKSEMRRNVLDYEPHLALFTPDDDVLVFYRKIASIAQNKLKQNGQIWLELNPTYSKEIADLFSQFSFVEVIEDMYKKNRFLKVIK